MGVGENNPKKSHSHLKTLNWRHFWSWRALRAKGRRKWGFEKENVLSLSIDWFWNSIRDNGIFRYFYS